MDKDTKRFFILFLILLALVVVVAIYQTNNIGNWVEPNKVSNGLARPVGTYIPPGELKLGREFSHSKKPRGGIIYKPWSSSLDKLEGLVDRLEVVTPEA